MFALMKDLKRDNRGVTMIEYALIAGLVAVVAIGILGSVGGKIKGNLHVNQYRSGFGLTGEGRGAPCGRMWDAPVPLQRKDFESMPIVSGPLTAPQWDLLKAAMLNSGKVPLQNKRALPDVLALSKGGYIETRKGERLWFMTAKGRAAVVVERKRK